MRSARKTAQSDDRMTTNANPQQKSWLPMTTVPAASNAPQRTIHQRNFQTEVAQESKTAITLKIKACSSTKEGVGCPVR